MGNIAIFGGTFSPPHFGHIALINNVRKSGIINKVIVIPAASPPNKVNSSIVDFRHRFAMCKLAFEGDYCEISDIENDSSSNNYTIDTLNNIQKKYKSDQLWLIIGSDKIYNFNRWYKYNQIIDIAKICVVLRNIDDSILNIEAIINQNLQLGSDRYIIINNPVEMASTEIRQRVHVGKSIERFVPYQVAEYIKTFNLYK